MNKLDYRATVMDLRDRPDVWRVVWSAPLDLKSARRSGVIARELNYHGLPYPEHVLAKSETKNGQRARVWAIWHSTPNGWRHRGMIEMPEVSKDRCEHCGLPRSASAVIAEKLLMSRFRWTPEQVTEIPDHLLQAVLDA